MTGGFPIGRRWPLYLPPETQAKAQIKPLPFSFSPGAFSLFSSSLGIEDDFGSTCPDLRRAVDVGIRHNDGAGIGTTRAELDAFTRCLRVFVESSTRERRTLEQFNAAYPMACATEQAAFRQAIVRRDTGMGATRATAEELANLAVEDARANFNDIFQMSLPPRPVAR